jgi:hypothetical protein
MTMILRVNGVFITLVLALVLGSMTAAQEGGASTRETTTQDATRADVDQLIKDLDANRFSKRQDASRKLRQMGAPAIDKLTEAALGDSREASSRAFAILKDHFEAGEGPLQDAAKVALKKLAESEKGTVARKAQDLLDPKPPPQAAQPIQVGGGQIQIQFGIGGAQQIQMRNVNGVKSIKVNDNGRQIQIDEDPNKGIKIEVNEKVDGKDVKKKYEAKNAAELKKKHPEGYKLYEKYGKGGQIQMQRNVPLIQGMQIQAAPALRGRRMIDPQPVKEQLEKISAQVEETQKLLEQLKENPQKKEMLEKAIQQLKDTQKALQETQEKTG